MKIFEVKINKYSLKDVSDKCLSALNKQKNSKPLWIVTLNPEILLEARKNIFYKKIINSADLKVIDGIGLKLISWLKKKTIGDRITGVELANFLLKKTIEKNLKIGIVYNKNGFSSREKIKTVFNEYKKIELVGVEREGESFLAKEKLENCHLILVGLGHPYQENFIYNNLSKFKQVKIVMGVGGAFDFWTGKKKRAPKILRKFGLEWFWRLLNQPNRLPRILKAIIVFPILALIEN